MHSTSIDARGFARNRNISSGKMRGGYVGEGSYKSAGLAEKFKKNVYPEERTLCIFGGLLDFEDLFWARWECCFARAL